ncbi:MAG TPA: hypothetical protein VJC21_05050 [Candidatus Nanoarchaeia archaeon]|nr:hypothetical protein [Candidatus Nanoarchaeia archaeon]
MESEKLTIGQRLLLFLLYGLVALMVVFSLLAMKDKNFAGYEKCVQKKCDRGGEAFCSKLREISNCCLGAGGQVAVADNKYTCVFEE